MNHFIRKIDNYILFFCFNITKFILFFLFLYVEVPRDQELSDNEDDVDPDDRTPRKQEKKINIIDVK